jgi:hypothetical protein
MVVCGSYIFAFSVSKDMKEKDIIREAVVAPLYLTLLVRIEN